MLFVWKMGCHYLGEKRDFGGLKECETPEYSCRKAPTRSYRRKLHCVRAGFRWHGALGLLFMDTEGSARGPLDQRQPGLDGSLCPCGCRRPLGEKRDV